MRFRSTIGREQFKLFNDHIALLERIGKNAIVHWAKDACRMIVITDDEHLLLYTTLNTSSVFEDFRIESRTDNVISTELLLANMAHALKPGAGAHSVTIKLTKRGAVPYLTLEMDVAEAGATLIQEVPVRVLGAAEMARYSEPNIPDPTVRLHVSSLRSLTSVVERLKSLSKSVALEADMGAASLVVGVRSDMVDIRTYYRGLARDGEGDDSVWAGPGHKATVTVNIREFYRILRSLSTLSQDMLLCVCPGSALVIHKRLDNSLGTLTFILSLLDSDASGDAGVEAGALEGGHGAGGHTHADGSELGTAHGGAGEAMFGAGGGE